MSFSHQYYNSFYIVSNLGYTSTYESYHYTEQHDSVISKSVSKFIKQEGLAVARIARDDPSLLPPEIPASSHWTIWVRRCQKVAKTSIYPSMQRYPGSVASCDHNAQTSQTDGQTDGH